MINRISSFAVILAAVVLAGCGGYASRANFEPEAVDDPQWTAQSDPDSIATWALRKCRWGSLAAKRNCVERGLGAVIRTAGVGTGMAALDRIAARDAEMLRESHGLAHGLGIAAYRGPETVAEDFAACPPTQVSGCYHGMIQGYFLDLLRRQGDITTAQMNALCEPHRANTLLYFQCTHGLGHGVMAMYANHVPASLEKCDEVTEAHARDSCYGGVFMESIIAATHPEHTAHSHAEVAESGKQGEHGGHGEGEHGEHGEGEHAGHAGAQAGGEHAGHGADHGARAMPQREPWKALDRDDPLYPCTVVAEKYLFQCYLIQTAAILALNNGDIPETAEACSKAPAKYVPVCYRSLGRDLVAFADRQPARTAELCGRAGAAALPECIRGAAETLVNVSSEPKDGFALCRLVSGEAEKTLCYEGVGGMVASVTSDPARREEHCATAEPGYVDRCRSRAGLAVPRAAGSD